jgi:hypothetical protein
MPQPGRVRYPAAGTPTGHPDGYAEQVEFAEAILRHLYFIEADYCDAIL